jgi:hypothetical protein
MTYSGATATFLIIGNAVTIDASVTINSVSSCLNFSIPLPAPFNNVQIYTAGSGVDRTSAVAVGTQVGSGVGQAINFLTNPIAGHTYTGHATYQMVSPF